MKSIIKILLISVTCTAAVPHVYAAPTAPKKAPAKLPKPAPKKAPAPKKVAAPPKKAPTKTTLPKPVLPQPVPQVLSTNALKIAQDAIATAKIALADMQKALLAALAP